MSRDLERYSYGPLCSASDLSEGLASKRGLRRRRFSVRLRSSFCSTEKLHFLGLRTDIPDVLGAMDVFVLSSDYEGNPLSVMEAMASGLPIVSTAAGGVPDLLEHGREGLIVQPGDVQGLSLSMTSLLRNRELRQALGRAAARRARERFDVSTMVQAHEALYESLVDQAHRPNAEGVLHRQGVPLRQV